MDLEATSGLALFERHSVPERLSQSRLRRVFTMGLASDPTTILLRVRFAVTAMAYFLSVDTVLNFEIFHCPQHVRPPTVPDNSPSQVRSGGWNKIAGISVAKL
jgi:hypothetical protein